MQEEKEYVIVEEGNEIIKQLRKCHPNCFWAVNPDKVIVLGVANQLRPFTMSKLAKITKIDAAHRTIIKSLGHKDIQYIIELYCTDWTTWSDERRQWIIAHEISHIGPPERKGLIKHDTEDFSWILDSVGIDWFSRDDLPSLIGETPYVLKQELFDRLQNPDNVGVQDGFSPDSPPNVSFE